jgi:hypothetical protein
MSGYISFVARRAGKVSILAVSSGSLKHIYDPAIYAGDREAFDRFVQRARLSEDQYVPANGLIPLAPWGGGIVVIDFDAKRQWDLQSFREMRCLSLNADGTWQHIQDWYARGWMGAGMVDPRTMRVVAPFVDGENAIKRAWMESVHASSEEAYFAAHPDLDPSSFEAISGATKALPLFRVCPPAWEITSFESDSPTGRSDMMGTLLAAGFDFSDADLRVWHDDHPRPD